MTDELPATEWRESHTFDEADAVYAAAVGPFLVAIVTLERQLDAVLARAFTGSWSEQVEFEAVWLEDLMLGVKIGRLEATLRARHQLDSEVKKLIGRLRAMNEIRNHLAHRMPATGLGEPITFHYQKGNRLTVYTASEIEKHTETAKALGELVRGIGQNLTPET